jgi:hypothetical protein
MSLHRVTRKLRANQLDNRRGTEHDDEDYQHGDVRVFDDSVQLQGADGNNRKPESGKVSARIAF